MEKMLIGNDGETIAADFLRKAGYKILAQNYRAKVGEIDIVAYKKGTYSFVEVKTRSGLKYGTPAEAVTAGKQRKIISTAWCFLRQNGTEDVPMCFDVMEVFLLPDGSAKCNHIINAFGG